MPSGPVPFADFSVHVAPTADHGTEVTIFGELDTATVERVKAALAEAVDAGGPVVVDLRACNFVDSRGIGALVQAALRLRKQNRRLLLRGVRRRVKRTLDVAGLTSSDLIAIEPEGMRDRH
jgi:anti-anti-sigma factor